MLPSDSGKYMLPIFSYHGKSAIALAVSVFVSRFLDDRCRKFSSSNAEFRQPYGSLLGVRQAYASMSHWYRMLT
jgi:hypothetical protein